MPSGLSNVQAIYSTERAFAALMQNGSVAAWGDSSWGGSGVPSGLSNVQAIYSTSSAFAALKQDGSVAAWGNRGYGGSGVPSGLSNVQAIYSTERAFAALKQDGSVAAWGYSRYGGSGVPSGLSNVSNIFGSTKYYSDSTSTSYYPCPPRYYGQGPSYCQACPGDVPSHMMNNFSLGIRSVVGSCIICDQVSFSLDGRSCVNSCPKEYTYYSPPRFNDGALSGCRACNYTGFYRNLTTNSCERCPKGKYSDGSGFNCSPCPRGEYAPFIGMEECNHCIIHSLPDGESVPRYLTLQEGSTSIDDCYRDCPAGKYGILGDMSSSCVSCPIDHYSSPGAAECPQCPPEEGTNGTTGNTRCMNVGFYQSCSRGSAKNASLYCEPCPIGNYEDEGSCRDCEAGTYGTLPKQTECAQCPTGTYSEEQGASSNTTCTKCPLGKYTPTQGSGKCIDCPPGSFCNETGLSIYGECTVGRYTDVKSRWNCDDCPAGRYQNRTGSAKCTECEAGTFNNETGSVNITDCMVCEAGRYAPQKGSGTCQLCGKDTFTDSAGKNTECTVCPNGETTLGQGVDEGDTGATECVNDNAACSPGERKVAEQDGGGCEKCKMGYYSPSGNSCLPCQKGAYGVENGSTSCTSCPPGRYGMHEAGAGLEDTCKECAKGMFVNIRGATACFDCPPGSACGEKGLNMSVVCVPGRYTDVKSRWNCNDCPAGRYQNSTGSAKCTECEAGTFNNKTGSVNITDCTVCEAGKYAPQKGTGTCQLCGKDTFTDSAGKHTKCTDCPFGKTTGGAEGATECVDKAVACAPGEGPVMSSSEEMQCGGCSAGKYSPSGSECLTCGAGTYSADVNSTSCSACPAGRYGVQEGQTSLQSACSLCPRGEYVNLNGSTKCSACPPGSFCGTEGMSNPKQCPVGQYTDTKERQSCKACPPGQFQNITGSAKCFFCPTGKFLDEEGANSSSQCMSCSPGSYGDKEGLPQCTRCPTGQVQPSQGQESCLDCALEGKIKTNNPSHTECVDDEALLQSLSVVTMIYSNGSAWVGSILIALLFVSGAATLTYYREKEPTRLANFSRVEAVYYSFLPGFSFGSWVFLVMTVASDDVGLAVVMCLSRLLHFSGGVVIVLVLFGDKSFSDRLRSASAYMKGLSNQRKYLDDAFTRERLYLVEMISLLSLCDITMFRFIPWTKSEFYTVSEGFPSMTLMNVCLVIKTVETFISVICDISYLALYANSDGVPSEQEQQTQALFVHHFRRWHNRDGPVGALRQEGRARGPQGDWSRRGR